MGTTFYAEGRINSKPSTKLFEIYSSFSQKTFGLVPIHLKFYIEFMWMRTYITQNSENSS